MRPTATFLILLTLAAGCDQTRASSPRAASPDRAAASSSESAASVKTSTPEYRIRASALETSGKVQFDEEHLVRIHAPSTGRVVDVLARPGETIKPGQRLLVLDCPDLGAAKSDYLKALADAERADSALHLARDLYDMKVIAQKDIREAENDYRKTLAERGRAASRLRTFGIADDRLKDIGERGDSETRIDVVTPRGGVIVERNVTAGQVVAYGTSDTPLNLFVIADLSHVWVLADVYEPDVPKIKLGQPATVTPPCCPGERYEGTVAYISDAVDKDTRTVKVRVAVPNRDRALRAEMFVRVSIATSSSRVLTLPQSAVHRDDGQTYVIVENAKDTFERRPITVGASLDGSIEVRDGVTPADRVVTTGSILLKKSAQ